MPETRHLSFNCLYLLITFERNKNADGTIPIGINVLIQYQRQRLAVSSPPIYMRAPHLSRIFLQLLQSRLQRLDNVAALLGEGFHHHFGHGLN